MHEKIEMFSARCKKLPARLREYNAYKTLKGQIEDFQVVLPILQEFTKVLTLILILLSFICIYFLIYCIILSRLHFAFWLLFLPLSLSLPLSYTFPSLSLIYPSFILLSSFFFSPRT